MSVSVLQARGVVAAYRGVAAVHGIDVDVRAGELVGILGRNGMGKSSLLGALFGTVARPAGTVLLDDRALPPLRPEASSRLGASFMPEDRGVIGTLTIAENLALARRRTRPVVEPTDVFPMLRERARQPAGSLSGGQQQQLGIARAMLAGSRLIAIDELTHGLQPSIVVDAFDALRTVADSGVGVLVVDQNPALVAARCDRILVMDGGRITLDRPVGPGVLEEVNELLVLR